MIALLELDYGQLTLNTAAEFQAFDQTDFAKLTVGFQLQRLGNHRIQLVTETRFHCLSDSAVKKISPY